MIDATTVRNILAADAELITALTGQVWDRGIKRRGPFSTPEAFDPVTNDLLPCAVCTAVNRRFDSSGPPGAYTGTMTVWLKAKETEQNAVALAAAAEIIVANLVSGFVHAGLNNYVEFTFNEQYGLRADPVIAGDLLDYVRFTIAGVE